MLSDSTKTSLIARGPRGTPARQSTPPAAAENAPPLPPTLASEQGLACHIVVVQVNENMRAVALRCETLPATVLAEMQPIVNGWRDWQYKLRDLRAIADLHAAGPIAIWFHSTRFPTAMDLPPPSRVTFEPVPFEEEFPGLAPLIGALPAARSDEQPVVGGSSASRPGAVRIRRPTFARRWLVRSGLLFFALPLLINALVQVAVHRGNVAIWGIWGGILGITALIVVLVIATSDRWFLAPGSVLIAKTLFGGWQLQFRRFIPADSTLAITPIPLGWMVALRRGWRGRPHRRMVTDLELCALLAVWRSTERPPTEQQVRGLGSGGVDA